MPSGDSLHDDKVNRETPVDNVELTTKAYMQQLGARARAASRQLARADSGRKSAALIAMADALLASCDYLLAENQRDLDSGKAAGLADALMDRLALTPARIEAMAQGLREVSALPDPVGEITDLRYRPSGIQVGQMRVPLGVVGMIYESRPNVTADAAGICLKAGNAVILRGGSEAIHSNRAIASCVRQGLERAALTPDAVLVVETTDRAAVGELITLSQYVDVIIPRGGRSLIERINAEARVPVIKHLDGVCHLYIDDRADLAKAQAVAFNAKTQRYGTCCTLETLLIAEAVLDQVLPPLAARYREAGVELRGCERCRACVADLALASEEDWSTEYLAPILSIKAVADMAAAIDHINTYGSAHTDAIMTEDWGRARRFLQEVDSSSVMVNASTRFADGYEYGLGAEIGISTDKLHARGPVGVLGLTTQKYIVLGDGHIRT